MSITSRIRAGGLAHRPRRLATGLLLAQGGVLLVAGLVAAVVAVVVGPPLFHTHMLRAGMDPSSQDSAHVEQAFHSAGLVTMSAAFAVALVVAAGVSLLLGRRLTGPLNALATSAEHVASGRHGARVRPAAGPAELTTVTRAFNAMASELEATEHVRKRLLSDLAHELRTPLTTLTAYVDALDDGVQELTPATVAVLREQVERLTYLARDLGAVSLADESAKSLHRELLDVEDLVNSVVTPVFSRLAPSVRLEVSVPAPETVYGDRARLQQVLTNLLDNAVRHTSDGRITVAARADGPDVVISVADTGDGIAAEHLAHVFERFYRTDTARDRDSGGSGLGLAICRAVIQAHGGSITVHSAGAGRGATFEVHLPDPANSIETPSNRH